MSNEYILQTKYNKWIFSSIGARLIKWESFDIKSNIWRVLCNSDNNKLPSNDDYNGCILFPWCNRLDGEFYNIPNNINGNLDISIPIDSSLYLHGGNIVNETWKFISLTEESEIVFEYCITPNEYYPHKLKILIHYQVIGLGESNNNEDNNEDNNSSFLDVSSIPSFFTIDDNIPRQNNENIEQESLVEGLRVEIHVENLEDKKEAWVGLGTHFYFNNPFGGSIDSMNLCFKVNGEVKVDEDSLIPIHPFELEKSIPLEHDFDALLPRQIGCNSLDSCFQIDWDALEEEEGSSLIMYQKDNFLLEIIPEFTNASTKVRTKTKNPLIQYLQVYTPEHRNSIALEPQTSVTNHFQHPYDNNYNNCVLENKGDKVIYSCLFIITWSY